MSFSEFDYTAMKLALEQAMIAFKEDEVPVGAIITVQNNIICKTHNLVEKNNLSSCHAEMLAIAQACQILQAKYLTEATLYVTLEPCLMCAGALFWNKIKKVIFGASDLKKGYSTYFKPPMSPFHPTTEVKGGLLALESQQLMQDFFKLKRNQKSI